MRVLHHIKYLYRPGGMQRFMSWRLEDEEAATGVVFLDEPSMAGPDRNMRLLDGLHHMHGQPNTLISSLRQRYRRAVEDFERTAPPQISVYHNCWGADLVADLDPAPVRIGYLHTDYPTLPRFLRHFAPYLDGFVAVEDELTHHVETVAKEFGLPTHNVPYPVHPPKNWRYASLETALVKPEEPIVIGFSGRLEHEQKRVERLPALIRALRQRGLNFRFEIAGKGGAGQELRDELAHDRNVEFLGWLSGERYWEALQRWKYMVYVSDFEGLPIALLEGLAAGVCPIYPDYTGGAGFVAQHFPAFVYPPGNLNAMVDRIVEAENASPEAKATHIRRARTLAHARWPSATRKVYNTAMREVREFAAHRRYQRESRPAYPSIFPIWIYHRFLKGLTGKAPTGRWETR